MTNMTDVRNVTDADAGVWIDQHDYTSRAEILIATIKFAKSYDFEFSNEDTFWPLVPDIIAGKVDESVMDDVEWLMFDAVEHLNTFTEPKGLIFSLNSGSLVLEDWK